jgi:uncharacterized protein YlxW (UPF0749 family)
MPEHLDRTRTPLLTLITLQSLDEDYEVVSRRRAHEADRDRGDGHPPEAHAGRSAGGAGRARVLGVLVLFGLLVAVAAVQTSREASVDDASRESLINRITSQRKEVAESAQHLAELRTTNTKGDSALTALGNQLSSAQARVADAGALTGFRAVTGPAVKVTLDSSPYADQNSQVRDSDIALLVDGLWGAGAEAITVNGQRLTGRTGIRTSGDAIEVNGVGIAPPYTILAIGNADQMAADFLNSTSGQAFAALADQYSFRYDLHGVGQVRMAPAPASLTRLRYAEAVPQGGTKQNERGRTP